MRTCRKNPILIRGYDYSSFERKLVKYAFDRIGECNPKNKSRHVTVLTHRGKICYYGVNDEKSCYEPRRFGFCSIHSEHAAVRRFLQNNHADALQRYDLFNVRINRFNEVVNSKPCKKCAYLLSVFQPRKVFFSNEKGQFEQWQS